MSYRLMVMAILLVFAQGAYAAEAWMKTKVIATGVYADGTYGGCVARLDADVATRLPQLNCSSSWVTLDCNGTLHKKDFAYRLLDSAQMAMTLSYIVWVKVSDDHKPNGYCLAKAMTTGI